MEFCSLTKNKWLLPLLMLLVITVYSVPAAPVSSSEMLDSGAASDQLAEKIIESELENRCEVDQDRKDLCERCIRFLFERNTGYLGCCTNYDGIYDFCENFLNYSFDESHSTTKAEGQIGSYRRQ